MELGLLSLATAFGAGLLASLSPCIYPMIPVTLGFLGRDGSRRRDVVFFVAGQALALTALGFLAVQAGEVFGFTSQSPWTKILAGLLLLLFGISSWMGELPSFFGRWNEWSETARRRLEALPIPGAAAIILGAFSALLASPCSSPILGGILVQVASQGQILSGLLLMVAFSLGLSMIFLILGLGWTQRKRLPKAGLWMGKVHAAVSVLLMGFGLFYFVDGLRAL